MFLNNRYYDPTTGQFISVDPLVATTGDPYLYAGGNPTTLSDPSGLDPGCRAGVARSECWSSPESGHTSAYATGRAAVEATMQSWEPSLSSQEDFLRAQGYLGWMHFDGSWEEWYQKINLFYWVHRAVQADISVHSFGQVMTEYTGCSNRIDLCALGAAGWEVAELKLLGAGGELGARSRAEQQLIRAQLALGGAARAGQGIPWPLASSRPLVFGPMSVTWTNRNGGLYTYEIEGGFPPLAEWRDIKATEPVLAPATADLPAVHWPSLPSPSPGVGVGGVIGAIILCVFFCIPDPLPVI